MVVYLIREHYTIWGAGPELSAAGVAEQDGGTGCSYSVLILSNIHCEWVLYCSVLTVWTTISLKF